MLKKSVGFLALLAFMGFMMPAQADAQGTTLYIGAGGSFPTSDFGDFYDTGWMGTAGALFGAGPVGVGAEFFYGQNSLSADGSDVKTTPWGFMGIVDYAFGQPGKIRPYVFGGLGVMINRVSGGEESISDTEFGYQAGAGLSFPIGATSSIYAEGRYMGSDGAKYFGALAGFAFDL
jgi:opacity protein-like surface antigen